MQQSLLRRITELEEKINVTGAELRHDLDEGLRDSVEWIEREFSILKVRDSELYQEIKKESNTVDEKIRASISNQQQPARIDNLDVRIAALEGKAPRTPEAPKAVSQVRFEEDSAGSIENQLRRIRSVHDRDYNPILDPVVTPKPAPRTQAAPQNLGTPSSVAPGATTRGQALLPYNKPPEVKEFPRFTGRLGNDNDLIDTGLSLRKFFHQLGVMRNTRQGVTDKYIVEKFSAILEEDALDFYISLSETDFTASTWSLDQWSQRFHNNYLTQEFHQEIQRQKYSWRFPRSENDPFQWASKFYKLCAAAEAEVTVRSFELAIIPNTPKYIGSRFTDACHRINPSHPSELISIFASVVSEQEDQAAAIESLNNRKRKNIKSEPSYGSYSSSFKSDTRLRERKETDKNSSSTKVPKFNSATSSDRKSSSFQSKKNSLAEKKALLKEKDACYKCGQKGHYAKNCEQRGELVERFGKVGAIEMTVALLNSQHPTESSEDEEHASTSEESEEEETKEVKESANVGVIGSFLGVERPIRSYYDDGSTGSE
jgi:hypothetical protein